MEEANFRFCSTSRIVNPSAFSAADGGADLLHDDGGQPLGGLVQQEQAGSGAEDPSDGQHLLLAARELGPLTLQPLAEIREQLQDGLAGHSSGTDLRREQEVLLHVEAGEDAPLLRADLDAQPRDAVRRKPDGLGAVHQHRALAARHHPQQRTEGGGLPRAVSPEQGDQLPGAYLEAHPVEDVRLAVPGLELLHLQEWTGRCVRRGPGGGQGRLRHAPPPCTPASRPCSSTPRRSLPRPAPRPGRAP